MIGGFKERTIQRSSQDQNQSLVPSESEEEVLPVCLSHNLEFTNLCFSCHSLTLCPECLPQHSTHDVTTIKKSQQSMVSTLNQLLVRLQSKSQILSLIHAQLLTNKNQLFQETQKYSSSIANQFDVLIDAATSKRNELLQTMQKIEKKFNQDIAATMESIRTQRMVYDKNKQIILRIVKDVNFIDLANFYAANVHSIQELTLQAEIAHYRKKLTEVKFSIDTSLINKICFHLNQIQLKYQQIRIKSRKSKQERNISKQQRNKSKETCKIQLKGRQMIKQFNINNDKSQKDITPLTPKYNERNRHKLFETKGESMLFKKKQRSSQITSMPVSPSRDTFQNTIKSVKEGNKKNMKKKKIQN